MSGLSIPLEPGILLDISLAFVFRELQRELRRGRTKVLLDEIGIQIVGENGTEAVLSLQVKGSFVSREGRLESTGDPKIAESKFACHRHNTQFRCAEQLTGSVHSKLHELINQ